MAVNCGAKTAGLTGAESSRAKGGRPAIRYVLVRDAVSEHGLAGGPGRGRIPGSAGQMSQAPGKLATSSPAAARSWASRSPDTEIIEGSSARVKSAFAA